MSSIPTHLIEQIKLGNVILFLGAGASYGAVDDSGNKIPNGDELSKLLVNKFLGPDYSGQSLSYVSELAISESGLHEVQAYIAEIINPINPCSYHYTIPSFKWKSIFTTNYDLIIEKVYSQATDSIQQLKAVYKNTSKKEIFTANNVLPYYKLHGCITDIYDDDAPLILTPDQFINHKSKRDRLFNDFLESSYDYPILFVGFGMADYDIRDVINKLDSNISARTRSYLVGPNIKDIDARMWEGKKITSIKLSFEDFLSQIDKEIDQSSRSYASINSHTKKQHPIYEKFKIKTSSLNLSTEFEEYIENALDYIHPNLSAPNVNAKLFYKGYFDTWDPIIRNLDATRNIQDGILSEVFLDIKEHDSITQNLFVIKGYAGSGKSVLLKRIAFEAGNTFERFCVFLNEDSYLQPSHVLQLFQFIKDRIYLFIDDLFRYEEDIEYLFKKAKKEGVSLTVIGAARTNSWNTEFKYLPNVVTNSYELKVLHDNEIRSLISLLERHGSLGLLTGRSFEQQFKAFKETAGRELLVVLYEATNGSKPFEEIIYDEYKSINDPQAQSLYLTICIFHRIGAETRAGFISRMHNVNFHHFKNILYKPLEGIVYDKKDNKINDYVYLTRNRLIAEILFNRVLNTPQDRFDEYIRMLKNLNIDYESDRLAFLSITNAKRLLDVFNDPTLIRELYNTAEDYCGSKNAKLFQQRAIFEMSSIGTYTSAQRFLNKALQIDNSDPFILHTSAEFKLKKAERSKLKTEFYSLVDECLSICNLIIKNAKYNLTPYPFHTILKANILKLKHILTIEDTPSIEKSIKDLERNFARARQVFPNEGFILEIESSFNELIRETESARELLFKAFNSNKSSPYLASRLSNFLEREDELEEAILVLKDALNNSSTVGDKDLNFKYAQLLQKTDNPDYVNISYHLRRSFTQGDTRYQAQFYYARSLFIVGELKKSSQIFADLKGVSAPPDIKYKPSLEVVRNNSLVEFSGTISSCETSFGFIRRDAHSDEIFFYRYEEKSNHNPIWDKFRKGVRVKFNIAFNYNGPVAIKIEII